VAGETFCLEKENFPKILLEIAGLERARMGYYDNVILVEFDAK
jgi:hypothetical protein